VLLRTRAITHTCYYAHMLRTAVHRLSIDGSPPFGLTLCRADPKPAAAASPCRCTEPSACAARPARASRRRGATATATPAASTRVSAARPAHPLTASRGGCRSEPTRGRGRLADGPCRRTCGRPHQCTLSKGAVRRMAGRRIHPRRRTRRALLRRCACTPPGPRGLRIAWIPLCDHTTSNRLLPNAHA
jgi:hypothetical protein